MYYQTLAKKKDFYVEQDYAYVAFPLKLDPYNHVGTLSTQVSCDPSLKSSPVHIAPACAGSDHFGSYVRSLSLHFFKRLFSGLEPMTSWSQCNSFTAAPGLPFTRMLNLQVVCFNIGN
jgi:hypothetical protein